MILVTSYLDAIAGYRFGGRSSGERFRDFLFQYSGQPGLWKKVSIVSLYSNLRRSRDPQLQRIAASVFHEYRLGNFIHYDSEFNPDIDEDGLIGSLCRTLPNGIMNQLKGTIKGFSYASILWKDYRTDAVHESLRPSEFPPPLEDRDVPYYAAGSFVRGTDIVRCVRFGIPFSFVLQTASDCLRRFRTEWEDGSFDFMSQVVPRIAVTTRNRLLTELPA